MIITEILNRRRAEARINYSVRLNNDLNELLQFQGLLPEKENLIKIGYSQAKEIVVMLLHRSLAFDIEIIPLDEAKQYSELLFEGINDEDCICYSNGEWNNYRKTNGFGWSPMTKSTFDAGVIILTKYITFCFWIQEED